jgi:hypothetical protein
MAYLVKRASGRVEVRESRLTARGPRSRLLVSFTGPLTPAVLETAIAQARRPVDSEALTRRARSMDIPVVQNAPESEARALLARLRRRDPMNPILAGLLTRALEEVASEPLPESIAEAGEWIGASAAERGAALRDLLETFGRIEASRPAPRRHPRRRFPRFSSSEKASAS